MSKEQPKHIAFYGQTVIRTIEEIYYNEKRIDDDIQFQFTLQCTGYDNLLRNYKTHLNKMDELPIMSINDLINKYTYNKFKRAEEPFKIIDIDPFIVIKEESDLFYKGVYGKVTKIYYNLDTDTLSADTSFVVKTINDTKLYSNAEKWRENQLKISKYALTAYKNGMDKWLEIHKPKTIKKTPDVLINADKVTVKKKHFWS